MKIKIKDIEYKNYFWDIFKIRFCSVCSFFFFFLPEFYFFPSNESWLFADYFGINLQMIFVALVKEILIVVNAVSLKFNLSSLDSACIMVFFVLIWSSKRSLNKRMKTILVVNFWKIAVCVFYGLRKVCCFREAEQYWDFSGNQRVAAWQPCPGRFSAERCLNSAPSAQR